MTTTHPTCLAAHHPELQAPALAPCISWGLPRDISPRFGARLIQSRYRLDFLSDRASLIERQHCITIQYDCFTCEADTLGSHGYVYMAIYPNTCWVCIRP